MSAEARLYDADTADPLGPATTDQEEASILVAVTDGGAGVIIIDENGLVIPAGSWDAQQPGTRRVYVA